MKFQWLIQPRHTQLERGKVTNLNYKSMHIWLPTWLDNIITFDHFESIQLILRSMPEIFYISIWWTSLWLFGHHTFLYKSLSLFPSRILVCAMAFAVHYLFLFWDLHWLSSLSKKNKRVERYIGTSLCKSQDQQNYWLIIHDKFEDLFTTII